MKWMRALMTVGWVAVMASGCIDATTVVSVKKDGSGTVMETVFLGKAMEEMMKQMADGVGKAAGAAPATPMKASIEPEKYKAKAATMGEGVKFITAKEVKRKDGASGVKVVYGFSDVRKLRLSTDPDSPGGATPPGAPAASAASRKPVTFDFKAGAQPELIVHMPVGGASTSAAPAAAGQPGATPPQSPPQEQLDMMKKMFDGFRVRMLVKVDGEIQKSNAAFVQQGSQSGKKQYVTLFDMDIGSMIGNEESFKKLAAKGQPQDMGSAMALFQDIPGLKVETAKQVSVVFN